MKRVISTFYHKILKHFAGNRAVFNDIYRRGAWHLGNNQADGIYSGSGSLPENTSSYENFVSDYISTNNIQSIVDIGCGDFQVANRILEKLPHPVTYTGIDTSSVVIARNSERYNAKNIQFICLDAVKNELPLGDLVLCREVLQHLSNADIMTILPKLKKYQFCLLTNTVHTAPEKINSDIGSGTTTRAANNSGLWMEHSPFNLSGKEVLRVKHSMQDNFLVTFENDPKR